MTFGWVLQLRMASLSWKFEVNITDLNIGAHISSVYSQTYKSTTSAISTFMLLFTVFLLRLFDDGPFVVGNCTPLPILLYMLLSTELSGLVFRLSRYTRRPSVFQVSVLCDSRTSPHIASLLSTSWVFSSFIFLNFTIILCKKSIFSGKPFFGSALYHTSLPSYF